MNESADDDGRKSRIQSEVDTVGCVKAWENGCRSEKTTVKVFEYLCIALNIVAVALVIAAIIHLSVKWSDIHDNTLMYHVFWRNMVRYCVWFGIALAFAKLFDDISECLKIKRCALWLHAKGVETSSCMTLKSYAAAKRRKAGALSCNLYIAYYARHTQYLRAHIITFVIKSVIVFICFIAGGICLGRD